MKKLVLGIILGVALLLSACGSMETSGESARTVTGQVAGYDGPAEMLVASTYGVEANLGTGSIGADGSFTFTLDDTAPEGELSPISSEACDGLTFSNPKAKALIVTELAVMSAGEITGYLTLADKKPGADLTSSTLTMRMYVDQNTRMQGTCEVGTSRQTANLDLKRGWNIVTGEISVDETNQSSETSLYSGAAANVKWFYSASGFGGGDVTDPPDAPDEISGQVQNYGGPEGYLEAPTNNSFILAGYGFIELDGRFSFQLNPTVIDAALEPITNLADCEGVVISDRDARITGFGQISVFSQTSDEVAGAMVRTDVPPTGGNEASYTVVGRYYADRDVTAQGQCDSGDRVDLNLERGWNVVTLKVEESANPLGTYTYTSGEPLGVAWYFVSNN